MKNTLKAYYFFRAFNCVSLSGNDIIIRLSTLLATHNYLLYLQCKIVHIRYLNNGVEGAERGTGRCGEEGDTHNSYTRNWSLCPVSNLAIRKMSFFVQEYLRISLHNCYQHVNITTLQLVNQIIFPFIRDPAAQNNHI